MLVDVHCHLDFAQFDADRDAVVERAKDTIIVNSTVDPGLVEKGLGLADRYDNVYCMLGFSASETDASALELMSSLIRSNRGRIVGVGEAGLDYYWVKDEAGRAAERMLFRRMADLSVELGLPIVVHSRDAESDCINILEERKLRAIMHCFSGTLEEARRAVDLGCVISIPANVASSKTRQKLVRGLPLESLVLETDAPYMSPLRGQRSEPANVRVAAETIAQLKGVGFTAVEDATTENALRFIGVHV
jgi:TatD DNase family protein